MKRLAQIILVFFLAFFALFAFAQNSDLLSQEEVFWLESRNNTVIVYPEKNNPPFSYTSSSGSIQGLSVDYIELVAEKTGMKIQYISPKSRNQVITEFTEGKGDVISGMTETDKRTESFLFTDPYVVVPTVIVVRKDYENGKSLTLADFNGKKVSVVAGSALLDYMRENYPRVVVEDVTDDEVSLQQIVLGEVDAGVMDVASLSFFLSKQVLSSVKIAGNTGFDYKPAFAVQKDKAILQAILDKGFTQITTNEREMLNEKWIVVPGGEQQDDTLLAKIQRSINLELLYIVFGLGVLLVIMFMFRYAHPREHITYTEAHHESELKNDLKELEEVNSMLAKELHDLKEEEAKLEQKIDTLTKKDVQKSSGIELPPLEK